RVRQTATTYGLAPFFLHFPKKLFVAKGARCDLSTAQVLERACLRHFWGGPYLAFFCSAEFLRQRGEALIAVQLAEALQGGAPLSRSLAGEAAEGLRSVVLGDRGRHRTRPAALAGTDRDRVGGVLLLQPSRRYQKFEPDR